MEGLPVLDVIVLMVLALSMVVGLVRGLAFELMSLAGWLVAFAASKRYATLAAPYVPVAAPDSISRHAVAFAAVFLATLLVWALLSRLLRLLVRATPLSVLDRLFGAVFGVLRAAVVLAAVVTVVDMTPLARAGPWQRSTSIVWLHTLLDGLKPLLPDAWVHQPSKAGGLATDSHLTLE